MYTCNEGYDGDGEFCQDIDGCAENPCPFGVECIDVVAPETGFVCGDCWDGYFPLPDGTCDLPPEGCENEIVFADSNLEARIRQEIGFDNDVAIKWADINRITVLDGKDASIQELDGIQCLTSLTEINFMRNQISDLSPLEKLINLTHVTLASNQIRNLSPLENLTNLRFLLITYNQIEDFSPLEHLTSLTYLNLGSNEIHDLTSVRNLENLTYLGLSTNQISDIRLVADLENLSSLYLHFNNIQDVTPNQNLINLGTLTLNNNDISDISPLVRNRGLGHRDTVKLTNNPIVCNEQRENILALLSRNVNLEHDCQLSF